MITVAIVNTATGALVTVLTASDQAQITANTPSGCAAISEVPTNLDSVWNGAAWTVVGPSVEAAQAAQIGSLEASYTAAIAVAVAFTTSAGIAETFQADPVSVNEVAQALLGYQSAQATPSGFYWLALDNTHVPFTYADLQGLSAVLMAQGWTAFAKLQTFKTQVRAATTTTQVQAVTWS